MRAELDADAETIDSLWNLPGFVTRTEDVSRRRVVSEENFAKTAAQLGLFGTLTDPVAARTVPRPDERCCGARCCCRCGDVSVPDGEQPPRVMSKVLIDPAKYCLFRPKSVGRAISYWDTWLLVLLLFVTVVVPLRIGFDLPLTVPWLVSDAITDISFIADIILNFVMCYEDPHTPDTLITDPKVIRVKYTGRFWFNGWFCVDVLSCLPITYVQLVLYGNSGRAGTSKLARLLRLTRLTRMLKLAKIANLLQRNAENLRDVDELAIVKSAFGMTVFAHLTACWWHYVGIGPLERVSDASSMPQYLASTDGATWIEYYDPSIINGTLGSKYCTSLYFATTTLSTVGYGDILPTNANEQLLCALCQVIGVFTFGYTMGTLSGYIMEDKMDARVAQYNEMMPRIEAFLREKGLSKLPGSDTEIKRYFGNVLLHGDTYMDEEKVIEYMRTIDPIMSQKVVHEIYHPALGKNSAPAHPVPPVGSLFRVFESMDDEVLIDINSALEPAHDTVGETVFTDGADIVKEGDVVRGIYVVSQGRCLKTTWSQYVRALQDHSSIDPTALKFCAGDIIRVTERQSEERWTGYVAWSKQDGLYTPSEAQGGVYTAWTKETAAAVSGEFVVRDAHGGWTGLVEADPWGRPHGVNTLGIPAEGSHLEFDPKEGELGPGDCFGAHAALGKGGGIGAHHIMFSVRAKQEAGGKPLKLSFLPQHKLFRLFEKHDCLEKTLRIQASLLDAVSGEPLSLERRRRMEEAGFPHTQDAANEIYDEILQGEKEATAGKLSYQMVLQYLDRFHNLLPLSPSLHHGERIEMMKSAFDADGGGDIDREEFWKGLQVFTDAVKASAKLKYPPRPEHALHTNVR